MATANIVLTVDAREALKKLFPILDALEAFGDEIDQIIKRFPECGADLKKCRDNLQVALEEWNAALGG